ncbi:hypothetical protein MTP04_03940 [Lysinibacillus sp. PLM2]|nr:hypothetical protein MTP04_03940 [Lysinibacillus sp. PLM2]
MNHTKWEFNCQQLNFAKSNKHSIFLTLLNFVNYNFVKDISLKTLGRKFLYDSRQWIYKA